MKRQRRTRTRRATDSREAKHEEDPAIATNVGVRANTLNRRMAHWAQWGKNEKTRAPTEIRQ